MAKQKKTQKTQKKISSKDGRALRGALRRTLWDIASDALADMAGGVVTKYQERANLPELEAKTREDVVAGWGDIVSAVRIRAQKRERR